MMPKASKGAAEKLVRAVKRAFRKHFSSKKNARIGLRIARRAFQTFAVATGLANFNHRRWFKLD